VNIWRKTHLYTIDVLFYFTFYSFKDFAEVLKDFFFSNGRVLTAVLINLKDEKKGKSVMAVKRN